MEAAASDTVLHSVQPSLLMGRTAVAVYLTFVTTSGVSCHMMWCGCQLAAESYSVAAMAAAYGRQA
jgi:hypothetical protein